MLGQLFGCDISLYPAHLATLNLAAREINEEANYPRITRRDFFDVDPREAFCEIPPDHTKIELPPLNAVVGNPPYVRQERIEPKEKRKLIEVVLRRFPGLRFSCRSDLHCYFWPAASAMLAEGGYFGFLTSSSWLGVEYGFLLQKWILENFKLVAVRESDAEPWFEDARVKTCATILRRCSDADGRMPTSVKFVKFNLPSVALSMLWIAFDVAICFRTAFMAKPMSWIEIASWGFTLWSLHGYAESSITAAIRFGRVIITS